MGARLTKTSSLCSVSARFDPVRLLCTCRALPVTVQTQSKRKRSMNPMGNSTKVTFPNACQLMRWHFKPMGFEATMDAPRSMIVRLFDRASGETVIAIAGIPCSTVMTTDEVAHIIQAVEDELESFVPPQAWRVLA